MALTFTADELQSRENCTNITIIEDMLVEDVESFGVFINSSDPSVMIGRESVPISLNDSSSKFISMLWKCHDNSGFKYPDIAT